MRCGSKFYFLRVILFFTIIIIFGKGIIIIISISFVSILFLLFTLRVVIVGACIFLGLWEVRSSCLKVGFLFLFSSERLVGEG